MNLKRLSSNKIKNCYYIIQQKALFVQWKGCRDWKLNEFDPLIEREMANLKSGSSSRSSTQEDIDASVSSTPVFLSSPRQRLSQLINIIRSPSGKILKRPLTKELNIVSAQTPEIGATSRNSRANVTTDSQTVNVKQIYPTIHM